jgi:NAD(P)-dependent dehydrogenase (short-subunit alcohol dehydrogenase family)
VLANPGQPNYGAAKAGIAALTLIAAAELGRSGVRVNAIAPAARTRMTVDVPVIGDMVRKPEDPDAFDPFDPAHASPLVAYLCRADCTITGKLFAVRGGQISEQSGWSQGETVEHDGDWTQEVLAERLGGVGVPTGG